jgi:ABC-2 type transport system permease protein
MFAGMVKYTGVTADPAGVNSLFKAMPKVALAILGISNLDLTVISGYYGILLFYAVIVGAILAISLGSKTTAFDINEKTSEFIFAKPASRIYIIFTKQIAGIILLALFSVQCYIYSLGGLATLGFTNNFNNTMLLLNLSFFVVMLIYFFIGALMGAISSKRGSLYANLIFLGTFIASICYDMIDNNTIIRFFSPMKFFDISEIVNTGSLSIPYCIASVVVIAALLGSTFYVMSKKDIPL